MSPHKPGSDFDFTEKALAALRVPAQGRDFYRDSKTEGLTLVVRPSGAKTYVWYRKVNGRPWSERLGTFPDSSIESARARAHGMNESLEGYNAVVKKAHKDKTDPPPFPFTRAAKPEPPSKELTLASLIDIYVERYLKGHAKNPVRAEKDLRQMVDFHAPEWKDRPLSKITLEDVSLKHHKIGARGTKLAANRVVERLRTFYNYARGNNYYKGDNPALFRRRGLPGVEKFKEQPRKRYLLAEELPLFLAALEADPNPDFRDYILFSLYTAARRSDVLSMKWTDVDLNRAVWIVPDPKSGRTYTISLSGRVLEALMRRYESRVPESPWVFPGVGDSGHIVDFKIRWRALLVRAKLDYPNGERQRPTLHDLRRTAATHALNSGVPLPVVSQMLGHADIGTTVRSYAHVLPQAQADATQVVSDAFDRMRAPKLLPVAAKPKRLKPAKTTLSKRKAKLAGKF